MKSRIPYTRPSITALEISNVTDAVTTGWGERCYDYIHRLEMAFCHYLGVRFAVACSSCTGALHLGMAALNIGHGDEVIVADTNWIASVAPIQYLGATPVFVDIDPISWCIDPAQVEKAITPRTKAIVAVHLYGNLCDMSSLTDIGLRYGIPVIEDAAEAIGSTYYGKCAGSIGQFGAFSFHGTKTVTTGEGGMFVTNDEQLFKKVLTLSNHGRMADQLKQFWPDVLGFKYKMSNIQAALGCAQIERIEELIQRKREILSTYRDAFKDIAGLAMNPEPEGTVNGAWMPNIVIDEKLGITREVMATAFARENIDARVFFWPLSSLPMFEPKPENKHSWSIPSRAINLPSYHDLSDADMKRICGVVREFCGCKSIG